MIAPVINSPEWHGNLHHLTYVKLLHRKHDDEYYFVALLQTYVSIFLLVAQR